MIVDLRSDTITKPTLGMLDAMMSAVVGDDVFGEDPTVATLESKCAQMLGLESGLFCPSGTMANQIAIRTLTQPQDEVICEKGSHVYLYEGGGIAYNSMVSVALIDGDRGRISADQVRTKIKPDEIHYPRTRLVALENTMNKGGGSYYTMDQIISIQKVCKDHGLILHLDGARIFNALVETGDDSTQIGKYFDTVSVCLSKGLGAPIGSLLLGNRETILRARRIRKVFGGGMRQAGYLAAAGIYALDHNIDRLKKDHEKARLIASMLDNCPQVAKVEPVDTNIIIFSLIDAVEVKDFLDQLKAQGILALGFGGNSIRMVTHLDIHDHMLEQVEKGIKSISNKKAS